MDRRHLGLFLLSLKLLAWPEGVARAEYSAISAQAWDLGGARDARTIAMAGAGEAVGGGVQGVLGNPAALVFSRAYEVALNGAWMSEAGFAHYGGAIADAVTSRTAGGLSAHYLRFASPELTRAALDVRGTAAYPLGDALSIGLAARLLRVEDGPGTAPSGGASPPASAADRLTFGLDAGLALRPVPVLRVGVLAKNLLVDPGFDLPRLYAAGAGLTLEPFTIESTAVVNTTYSGDPRWRSSSGIAWAPSERYALHVGYRYDQGFGSHALGAGLSMFDRAGALELAVRHDVAGAAPCTFLSVGIRIVAAAPGARSEGGEFAF